MPASDLNPQSTGCRSVLISGSCSLVALVSYYFVVGLGAGHTPEKLSRPFFLVFIVCLAWFVWRLIAMHYRSKGPP